MLFNTSQCRELLNASGHVTVTHGIKASVEMWEAIIIFIGTGLLASLMAMVFTFFRKFFYNDKVDTLSAWCYVVVAVVLRFRSKC